MSKTHLLEAASLVSEAPAEDGTWKIRLISEGKGSSGVYTNELLEKHHSAFDGILSFKNHPTGWDGPETRDFTMIVGKVVGETWIEKDERGLTAVYGNYLPDPEYREKLERYKEDLGLSIYIEGSGYEGENGDFIVDWFNPEDPYASIDVVIAPGARGKFMENMRKVYSDRTENQKPTVTVAEKEERNKEIMEEKLDKLIELMNSLVAEKVQKEAEAAQVEADAEAIKTAVESYDAAVKMVNEAELFEAQKAEILAVAKEGKDISALVESAKAVKEEALKAAQGSNTHEEAHGVVLNGRKVESATELGKVFG